MLALLARGRDPAGELEVGAVIGRRVSRVSVEEAADYIAGYTIFNDWSARDIQRREMSVGVGPGVGKDFASSIGPWTWRRCRCARCDGSA